MQTENTPSNLLKFPFLSKRKKGAVLLLQASEVKISKTPDVQGCKVQSLPDLEATIEVLDLRQMGPSSPLLSKMVVQCVVPIFFFYFFGHGYQANNSSR